MGVCGKGKGRMKLAEVPEVSDVDIAFPASLPDFDRLLAEAQEEGLEHGEWSRRFSDLFFSGGRLNPGKNVPDEERWRLIRYFKACAGSFAPKHEHKTAVCAYLLRTLETDRKKKRHASR